MTVDRELYRLISGSVSLEEIYRVLSEEVQKLVPFDRMAINVFGEGQSYSTVYNVGLPHPVLPSPVSEVEEESATRWATEHHEPVICEDLQKDQRFPSTRRRYERLGVRSYMIIPLLAKGKVLGGLNLASKIPACYGKNEIEILSPVVDVLSLAIENANLYREAQRREEIQRLLKEVSQDITSLDMDSLLTRFAERVRHILQVDIANVRLIERGPRRTSGVSGIDDARLQEAARGSDRISTRRIAESRKPLVVSDIAGGEDASVGETARKLGVRSYVAVPLFSRRGELLGVVRAMSYQPRRFTQEEVDLLQQMANGLAIALDNARLVAELGQAARDQLMMREFLSDILLLDLDELLQKMTDQAASLFQAEFAWLRLIDDEGRIKTHAISGDKKVIKIIGTADRGRRGGRTRQMLEEGRPVAVRDMAEDPTAPYHWTVKEAGLHGFLGAPLFSKDRKPLGVLYVCTRLPRDFSEREIHLIEQFARGAAIAIENARLFEEARRKSQELADAYRAKSDFLNTMAHELKTPLNVIIGAERLVADGFYGDLTADQKKGLEPIGHNAKDLLNLINGILDLARLEARRVPVKVEEFGLGGLMEELEASFAPLAREKGLGLKFTAVKGMTLKSDRSKLKEILQNLIGNAVKYTDHGEVAVRANRAPDGGDGIVFSVQDTGIGIKSEDLGKVFEPFYMVEGVDRRKYPGSGLGLSIVKQMVELLGGQITVESELGQGSTFKVRLSPSYPNQT